MIALLTAGGTREPIDAVRHVTNVATGSLPAAMADELLARGAVVHYVHGPGAVLPGHATVDLDLSVLDAAGLAQKLREFSALATVRRQWLARGRLHLHPVTTAAQVAETLERLARELQPDLVACAMAVADYAPVPAAGKLSSQQGEWSLPMRPTAKAIDRVRPAAPHCTLLGFKLLAAATESELCAAAQHLAQRAQANLVFANDIVDYRAGVRRGLLVDVEGNVRRRLEGGTGETGLRRLAAALVDAFLPFD